MSTRPLLAAAEGERDRKAEHIRLALDRRMQVERSYFDDYRFEHRALPEIDFEDVRIGTEFLGRELKTPLLISCMTGGTGVAERINRRLAEAAEAERVALGVGSQRKAIDDPETAATFRVREFAPNVPILANLGAVQLNYGYGIDECRRAIDMVEADALVLHLNALQEALQPEGQLNFRGLLPKIARVVEALDVPVVVKEIGCGISAAVGRELANVGVRILDTAGVGGTSLGPHRGGPGRRGGARRTLRRLGSADTGVDPPVGGGARRPGDRQRRHPLRRRRGQGAGPGRRHRGHGVSVPGGGQQIDRGGRRPHLRTAFELRTCMFCTGAADLAALRRVPLLKETGDG